MAETILNSYSVNVGNTNTSVGVFCEEHLQKVIPIENNRWPALNESAPIILCQTRKFEVQSKLAKKAISLPKIKNGHFFDMPVQYRQSLGEDRLANAYYLYKTFEFSQTLCVIDAGTFITVDFIDKKKGFLGGYIFPGSQLLKKCYDQGANLNTNFDLGPVLGLPHNTQDSMANAVNLLLHSICERPVISASEVTFVTGGDHELLLKFLPQGSEVSPHLTHLALNFILHKLHA